MSTVEAEIEVVALVVSKDNIQGSHQNCESIHQAEEANQEIIKVYPRNEFLISELNNSSDRDSLNMSTEKKSTNVGFANHQNINRDQNADRDAISNRSPCYLESTSYSYCDNEEIPNYRGSNFVNHDHKQINYEENNYYADKNLEEYSDYSNNHVYQSAENDLQDQSGEIYNNYETDKTSNKLMEPSSPNKSHLNTIHIHSNGQSYIQMTNVPIESQESYQQRKYEYFDDVNSQRNITSDENEVVSQREYTHPENGYTLQEKDDSRSHTNPCHNKYYNYDLQNEKILYEDEIVSPVKTPEDFHHCYKYNEGRPYNREEATHTEHNYQINSYNDQQNSGNQTYDQDGRPYPDKTEYKDTFKRKHSLQEEDDYSCKENSYQKGFTSAVDLRIMRHFKYPPSSDEQPSVPQHVSEDVYPGEDSREEASVSGSLEDHNTTSSSSSVIVPNQTCNEEVYNPTSQPKSFHYRFCETNPTQNNEKLDAATNTDRLAGEDKESQTNLIELKDVAIQTDIENNKVIPFSLFRNIQAEIVKYSCPICKRTYISKSSLDRHLRTHEKGSNVLSDLKLTTSTKVQICKRPVRNTHMKTHKPIIIQIPRSVFQCDMCEKTFPNQMEKDNHSCNFNPFPLTKCPECHLKFYTSGGLNEHKGIVHKKESTYYCIFCSKSFSSGYSFHLHLDEHLSNQ